MNADSPETPLMLVVPPPSRLIEVSLIGQIDARALAVEERAVSRPSAPGRPSTPQRR
jgi:hypothetical protein